MGKILDDVLPRLMSSIAQLSIEQHAELQITIPEDLDLVLGLAPSRDDYSRLLAD